jgi:glyoxylase-like metal-dependent hydrolase (beta-lactamase superfamily II)
VGFSRNQTQPAIQAKHRWTLNHIHASDVHMAFLSEPEPRRFTPLPAAAGISRIVAPNPGPMTYHGTNTWLIEGDEGLTVIDPGPDHPEHIAAIAAAGPVTRIVLTHTHPDHMAGAPALRAATGAAIHAWGRPWAEDFTPDVAIADGQTVGPLTALHTPGHASDHLCFALVGTKILFSGDHVMSWNTSVVAPPDGDMGAYMAGLRLLLARDDELYLCGHGAPLPNPLPLVRGMLSHRAGREASILAALRDGPMEVEAVVAQLYAGLAPHLVRAASGTVLAHLFKLAADGRVVSEGSLWGSNR